ncbi:MAG: hypothetical protein MJY56_04980 [Bacteroidales bacterium]|nr:hypothetical protein [Bacteroidales bacterium]
MKRFILLFVALGLALAALSSCSKPEYGDIIINNATGYNFTRCTFHFVNSKNSENDVAVRDTGAFPDKGSITVSQGAKFFKMTAYTDDGHFVMTYGLKALDGMTIAKSDIRIVTRAE